jgi:hypothetical protein
MAKQHLRKMVVTGDHLVAPDGGPPWTVLWDTAAKADGNWSIVRTPNEATALERAAHFVKLGFVVHVIKDPSGTIVLNAREIARRFGPTEDKASAGNPAANMPTAEESAHEILRGFVEKHLATPGRMLAAATLQAPLTANGVSRMEFERAVSFAKEHGWLSVADGVLTLTQAGYAAATE